MMSSLDDNETKEDMIGLDQDKEETVTLVSQEGAKFKILKKIAICSELVKTMVEGQQGHKANIAKKIDAGIALSKHEEEEQEEEAIPLPNVKSVYLTKIIEYMTYHLDRPMKEINKPLKSANMHEAVSLFDAEFINVEQDVLFELILATNYMDIKSLLDLCCAKVASMIKGKTPEAIRKTFNIINEFSPAEEEQIMAENRWAEEN